MNASTAAADERLTGLFAARSLRAPSAILAAALTACLCSCSTQPPVVEAPFGKPLPLTVCLAIDELPDGLGTAEQWRDDLLAVCGASRLCQALWLEGNGGTPDADVHVTIRAAADSQVRTEIDVSSAVVTTLAWSCVPPLHFFLSDVAVFPELDVRVSWKRADVPSPTPKRPELKIPVYTNYVERYPFFSWETLGTIVMPSFIFSGGEREHLLNAIAAQVRFDVAVMIAGELNSGMVDPNDLLRNLTLQRSGNGIVLVGEGSPDLYEIKLRLDDIASKSLLTKTMPYVDDDNVKVVPVKIDVKLPATQDATLLRIEARSVTDGLPGGRPLERYSLRLDDVVREVGGAP